ncbi:MAG: helix-turn-helix transcriptional regulator [Firmicutes bacterium]|nr:helix-turn-helix transcriptional regulator [Bacillota bacterium]
MSSKREPHTANIPPEQLQIVARRLGQAVRQARQELGLTQTQLAAGVVSKSFISQVENGAALPSLPVVLHLAEQLQLSLDQLFGLGRYSPSRPRRRRSRGLGGRGSGSRPGPQPR